MVFALLYHWHSLQHFVAMRKPQYSAFTPGILTAAAAAGLCNCQSLRKSRPDFEAMTTMMIHADRKHGSTFAA